MTISGFFHDERGAAFVEFGFTAPAFFLLLLGGVQVAFWVWTVLALQTGAELAARCAVVNTSVCSSTSATQNYAAQRAFGLGVPASAFSVSQATCGVQVAASYTFLNSGTKLGIPAIVINAQACYPK